MSAPGRNVRQHRGGLDQWRARWRAVQHSPACFGTYPSRRDPRRRLVSSRASQPSSSPHCRGCSVVVRRFQARGPSAWCGASASMVVRVEATDPRGSSAAAPRATLRRHAAYCWGGSPAARHMFTSLVSPESNLRYCPPSLVLLRHTSCPYYRRPHCPPPSHVLPVALPFSECLLAPSPPSSVSSVCHHAPPSKCCHLSKKLSFLSTRGGHFVLCAADSNYRGQLATAADGVAETRVPLGGLMAWRPL